MPVKYQLFEPYFVVMENVTLTGKRGHFFLIQICSLPLYRLIFADLADIFETSFSFPDDCLCFPFLCVYRCEIVIREFKRSRAWPSETVNVNIVAKAIYLLSKLSYSKLVVLKRWYSYYSQHQETRGVYSQLKPRGTLF